MKMVNSMGTVTNKHIDSVKVGNEVCFKRKINRKTLKGENVLFHFKARLRKNSAMTNIIQINKKQYDKFAKNGI